MKQLFILVELFTKIGLFSAQIRSHDNVTYSSAACKSFLLMVMFGIFGPGIILTSLPRDSSLFTDEELRKDCNVLLG